MLKVGIVGLPNVGKSTLFNALLKKQVAEAKNYPFTTIDPNVGVVEVPDDRLAQLAKVSNSEKIVPTTVEFVDIAGLVKDAHKGEGLGNKFLSHIREVNAIAHVVRAFEGPDVVHAGIDPKSDIETINTELVLADLETLEKLTVSKEKELKGLKISEARAISAEVNFLKKLKAGLDTGVLANEISPTNAIEERLTQTLSLITIKPVIYVFNVSESVLNKEPKIDDERRTNFTPSVTISAKIEAELAQLSLEEQKGYLEELGLEEPGLERLIRESYKLLGLITYFTSGEKETRAWTVSTGTKAPQAAGEIHTDFEKGFIKAEVIGYELLVQGSGWQKAREKGLVRLEGKDYEVADGDVVIFKFNV